MDSLFNLSLASTVEEKGGGKDLYKYGMKPSQNHTKHTFFVYLRVSIKKYKKNLGIVL